ncbi:Ubiquitin-like protein [Ascosphaera pollenicola]|nr:Ubiquitin-like protein [Ascosphaera pollenicola]
MPSGSSGANSSAAPAHKQDEDVKAETLAAPGALADPPRNACDVLQDDIDSINAGKVNIRFKPLPSAPILKTQVFKINASQKFEAVVRFLKKKLNCKPTDSVFCYVNSVFAPALDENVGGLWRCFKTDDQLIPVAAAWQGNAEYIADLPAAFTEMRWTGEGESSFGHDTNREEQE